MRLRPGAALAAAVAVAAVLYPIIVYFSLEHVSMSVLGAGLLVLAGVRLLGMRSARGEPLLVAVSAAAMAAGGLYTLAAQSELGVRVYPVLMSLALLVTFASSLRSDRPVIERMARLVHSEISPPARRYMRRVTHVWCAFFAVNGAIALYTALAASWATWTLYNGLISYCLIGLLFVGEYAVRQRFQAVAR